MSLHTWSPLNHDSNSGTKILMVEKKRVRDEVVVWNKQISTFKSCHVSFIFCMSRWTDPGDRPHPVSFYSSLYVFIFVPLLFLIVHSFWADVNFWLAFQNHAFIWLLFTYSLIYKNTTKTKQKINKNMHFYFVVILCTLYAGYA